MPLPRNHPLREPTQRGHHPLPGITRRCASATSVKVGCWTLPAGFKWWNSMSRRTRRGAYPRRRGGGAHFLEDWRVVPALSTRGPSSFIPHLARLFTTSSRPYYETITEAPPVPEEDKISDEIAFRTGSRKRRSTFPDRRTGASWCNVDRHRLRPCRGCSYQLTGAESLRRSTA